MIEEWKDYDGVISVSNKGNVRNNKTGYIYSKYDKINKEFNYFVDIKTGSCYYGYNKHRFSHILNRHEGVTKRFIVSRVKEKRA
nr:MAG TPA: hypothetical protein [Caudoviricetes sp.]